MKSKEYWGKYDYFTRAPTFGLLIVELGGFIPIPLLGISLVLLTRDAQNTGRLSDFRFSWIFFFFLFLSSIIHAPVRMRA